MTFQENLILLVIGSVVTFFLGTWLTNSFQKKQKARDIERENFHREIEIRDNMIRLFSEAQLKFEKFLYVALTEIGNKEKRDDIIEVFHSAMQPSNTMTLLLRTYYGDGARVFLDYLFFPQLMNAIKNHATNPSVEFKQKIYEILESVPVSRDEEEKSVEFFDEMTDENIKKIQAQSIEGLDIGMAIQTKLAAWSYEYMNKINETHVKQHDVAEE